MIHSQALACSMNKLRFIPAKGRTPETKKVIDLGIVNIRILASLPEIPTDKVKRRAFNKARNMMGINLDDYEHVLLALPTTITTGGNSKNDGSDVNWSPYAKIGGNWVVMKNVKFPAVDFQMHEFFHNYGLAHSNFNGVKYGDRTGYMGRNGNQDNARLCFNAAKSWQLGWYVYHHKYMVPSLDEDCINLVGVNDLSRHKNGTPNIFDTEEHTVILRIASGGDESVGDFMLMYNQAPPWYQQGRARLPKSSDCHSAKASCGRHLAGRRRVLYVPKRRHDPRRFNFGSTSRDRDGISGNSSSSTVPPSDLPSSSPSTSPPCLDPLVFGSGWVQLGQSIPEPDYEAGKWSEFGDKSLSITQDGSKCFRLEQKLTEPRTTSFPSHKSLNLTTVSLIGIKSVTTSNLEDPFMVADLWIHR
jgi:hypothetical protein